MQNHGYQDQPLNVITNFVQKLMQRRNHHGHMLEQPICFGKEAKSGVKESF